jgi:hypothetical protein
VFDLIDKIRQLSLHGNASAKSLENKLQTYIIQIENNNPQGISSVLQFEREVIELCNQQLEFFDQYQMSDLIRLREDRHRCAHPSFQQYGIPFQPSAEQARTHLKNAVDHVLSQPPVQGKAALVEIKAAVASKYFPKVLEKARVQLENAGLDNPTNSLIRSASDEFVFSFVTEGDVLYKKTQAIYALNALLEMHPTQIEQRTARNISKVIFAVGDDNLSWAISLVTMVNIDWLALNEACRNIVLQFLRIAPIDDVLPALKRLSKISELRSLIKERLESLDIDSLAEAVEHQELQPLSKERALGILSSSSNWNAVNNAFETLIFPIFSSLTKEDARKIIEMPKMTGADLRGAHGMSLFIQKIRESLLFEESELDDILENNHFDYLLDQSKQS